MNKTKISFYIPTEVLERVDRLAKMAEMDRTRMMVNMIDEFSKSLDTCGKVGILQLGVIMRNFNDRMGRWARELKEKKIDI